MRKRRKILIILTLLLVMVAGKQGIGGAEDYAFDGPPPITPRWAYEPWIWEDYGNAQNSILKLVDEYKSHEIPVGVVIIDSPWEAGKGLFRDLEVFDESNEDDWSIQYNLLNMERQFGDREYRFSTVPDLVARARWLRTANDSKTFSGDVATFTMGTGSTVYIAHDVRITTKPGWLDDWTSTGETLTTDAGFPVEFEIYEKKFSKGDTVTLGRNSEDDTAHSCMYTVMLSPDLEDYSEYNSFKWNRQRYENPEEMIKAFHEDDIRVILWATGLINEESEYYDLVKDEYCFPEEGEKKCALTGWWKGGGDTAVHIDFRKPEARQWFKTLVDPLIVDQQDETVRYIDGWKCDMGANKLYDPDDTATHDLRDYYYATFYRTLKELNPEGIIVARAYSGNLDGYLGAPISDSPVSWQGDYRPTLYGLWMQMQDIYESARRGYSAPGVAIGGYIKCDVCIITPESLIRSAQFGALTPYMENGSWDPNHEPWRHGEDAIEIYRYYATLHSELVPYFFSYGVEAHQTRTSILRETDDDKEHHKIGDNIFVSIVTRRNRTWKEIDFPEGDCWINYWDETDVHCGGETVSYQLPADNMKIFPIFIRVGAIIPLSVHNDVTNHGRKETESAEFDPADKITLGIYPGGESEFLYHHPIGDGTAYQDFMIKVSEDQGIINVDSRDSTGDVELAQIMEAEDAKFIGEAGIRSADCMSGGKGVGWLGKQPEEINHLEFSFSADQSGEYALNIDYISGEDREVYMRINGGASELVSFENTGSWHACGRRVIPAVELENGINTIRLFNETARGPDIDKIEILPTVQNDREFILRVKSFIHPTSVTADGAEILGWFYREADDLIIISLVGNDFTITIDGLEGYDTPDQYPLKDLEVYDAANADDWSVRHDLQEGDVQYGDRAYRFSSVPGHLAGAQWISTANDSKSYTGEVASFTLNFDATVFIAHDRRVAPKPSWLDAWQATNDTLQNDTQPGTVFDIYKQVFAGEDRVSLGPNSTDGTAESCMYTVFLPTVE